MTTKTLESTGDESQIFLTQTVQKGGCAAKVPAEELRAILRKVRFPPAHPDLLVDAGTFDDAAIYQVAPDLALVQTLDFFTPIVDSPRLFGAVAAANALSDVFAMGGQPLTAMGILAFPGSQFSRELIAEVLQGASDKIAEAGACFVGGHSIDDDTLKFGLSVTGRVHPDKVWSNSGAKNGQKLILTKALGTGTITAALKRREVRESDIEDCLTSMGQLNAVLDLLSADPSRQLPAAVTAATDITGFGLSGHSVQMAEASGVSFCIEVLRLRQFARVAELLEKGFLTKAHRSNESYTRERIEVSKLSPTQKLLLHDPQTSGGLLLAVEAEQAAEVCNVLRPRFAEVSVIGDVLQAGSVRVNFV